MIKPDPRRVRPSFLKSFHQKPIHAFRRVRHALDRDAQGRGSRRLPETLGGLLREARRAGAGQSSGHSRSHGRRGGRGDQRLRELLSPGRARPVSSTRRPRRPLAVALRVDGAQGHQAGELPGTKSRGGGRVQSLADLDLMDADAILAAEPSPELAAQRTEECQRLLARLPDESLRTVALWKMEGYTNAEIAARLGCVPQTVERKLRAIRTVWSNEASP